MATHLAQCACGALKAVAEGEPDAVVICHCLACQRRSGSPFGAGAYYPVARVRISGESKTFRRPTDAGRHFTHHFCPNCGTALYWIPENKTDQIGIAVGGFADPRFAPPARSVWEQSKHDWIGLPERLDHFPRGRG